MIRDIQTQWGLAKDARQKEYDYQTGDGIIRLLLYSQPGIDDANDILKGFAVAR